MKSVMITGGSGFFGTAFAKKLLKLENPPERLIIFSRGEHRQFLTSKELDSFDKRSSLRMMIGDVRDRDRLRRAMQGVEVVIHAAALKRIETAAYNPLEVCRTNVDGAVNIIEASQDAGVKRVVALSTDKAFEPVSPYGTSKALAESLFIAANNTTGWNGTKFSVTRYGNIWGSTGSIVPVWKALMAAGAKSVPVTDPECTRFFMRMEEAIELVFDTALNMKGGETMIPTLPAYRVGDLALAFGAKMAVKGLPTWEKLHESMGPGNSSNAARRMTVHELRKELRRE